MMALVALVVVAVVLGTLVLQLAGQAREAGYRRAQLGGRQGVARWAAPPFSQQRRAR